MLLALTLSVVFAVVAYRLIRALSSEFAVLSEFKQPKTLPFAVALFPLGPIALLLPPTVLPISLTVVLAFACYIPALVISRNQDRALQTSGTDRVHAARSAIERSFAAALVGLIYVAVSTLFVFGPIFIKSVGQGV